MTLFAAPVKLKVASRGNVREGPGTSHAVLYSLDAGAIVTGVSWADDWIRVMDERGRAGWIYRNLVERP